MKMLLIRLNILSGIYFIDLRVKPFFILTCHFEGFKHALT